MATTFNELWTELETAAKAEVAKLKADAVALEKLVVPGLEQAAVTVLSQYKGLAMSLIAQFAGDAFKTVSGEEKIGTLVTAIYQAAVGSGKAVAIQDVQMYAQQAFQLFQKAVATAIAPA